MDFAILALLSLMVQQPAAGAVPAPPAQKPVFADCAPAQQAQPGEAKGFSGKVQAASSNTATLRALTFRVVPCRKPDGESTTGVAIDVVVKPDGSFSSEQPLPASLSSIDTGPTCLMVEALEVHTAQGASLSLVAEGAASSALGVASGVIRVAAPIIGNAAGKIVTSALGGINLGCPNAQRPREEK